MSLNAKINIFAKRFNIGKYLRDKSLPFREADSPNGLQIVVETCPFCKNVNYKGNIHPNRLYIRADDKRFICYNCNTNGNIILLLSQYEELAKRLVVDKYIFGDYVDLLPNELKDLLEVVEEERFEEKELEAIDLPNLFTPLIPYNSGSMYAYQYLNDRGILQSDLIEQFDIRYSSEMRRVIFPIYFEGECKGWQGRDITGVQEPKYLINKGLQKQLLIFNYDHIKDKEFITITEGPIDAIKSYRINGTCLFGKSLSITQERYLLRCPNLKQIYLCLDNYDPEAVEAQRGIAERLASFYEIFFIQLPNGKDAGDMSFEEMVWYKENAVKYNPDTLSVMI